MAALLPQVGCWWAGSRGWWGAPPVGRDGGVFKKTLALALERLAGLWQEGLERVSLQVSSSLPAQHVIPQ